MMNNEQQVKRLNSLRRSLETKQQDQGRLVGERDSHAKRCEKLRKECEEKYGMTIEDLSAAIDQLENEAAEALDKAEQLLEAPDGKNASDA